MNQDNFLNPTTQQITFSDGRTLSLETGKLAKLAHGSVVLRMGRTMLLATVTAKDEPEAQPAFLPLSVDYQERFASMGKIPGSFFRREGRLSEHEILVSRLVDRAIRPLFPSDYFLSTQVNVFLISADPESPPEPLAALATSAALLLSDLPFAGPISEVRVAKVDGKHVANPSYELLQKATLDLIVAADKDNIMMVEGEAKEASSAELLDAVRFAHEEIKAHCTLQEDLLASFGKKEKRSYASPETDDALYTKMNEQLSQAVRDVAAKHIKDKAERNQSFGAIVEKFKQGQDNEELNSYLLSKYFRKIQKEVLRTELLSSGKRLDGRGTKDIRPIVAEVDYLPSAHGSALFTRGETQALATATLGTKMDEQLVDNAMISGTKKFLLHYNFPSFSTGEVKPNRGPGRREIGHGNLAQRALKAVLPPEEDNPYTIRLVSDILESNGSSSMATVCAGALALMDAGVTISSPVAGIAMGLVLDEATGKYEILSDILGDEDQLGDMDFKIACTKKGITACQMDIKLQGLSFELLEEALSQAQEGALHILGVMDKVLAEPRDETKGHIPRSIRFDVPQEMIGAIIGPGGKIIQEIQRESGTRISIEDKEDRGEVNIFSPDQASLEMARDRIKSLTSTPDVGSTYKGKVEAVMPYGAFIEFMPGKSGLLHISEIAWERLASMDGIFDVGDEVEIQLVSIDKKTGKYRLSRKVLLPNPNEGTGQAHEG